MNAAGIEYASENGKTLVRLTVTTYDRTAEAVLRKAVRGTGRRAINLQVTANVEGFTVATADFRIPLPLHIAAIGAVMTYFTEEVRFRCTVEPEREMLCKSAMVEKENL